MRTDASYLLQYRRDELVRLKESLQIAFEVFWISDAAGKAQEETNIPCEDAISPSELIIYFVEAGKVGLENLLEALCSSRVFIKTISPLLPIGVGGSQLKLISSIRSDLNFQVNRLGVEAYQSLEIAT